MQPLPDCTREQWSSARPELDTSSMDILGPLKRAQAIFDLALEPVFDGAEVTSAELDLMLILRHVDRPVIARQLSEQTHRSRAGTSKILAKLERRGLVVRTPSESDRRASVVRLTEDGALAVDSLFPRQLSVEARLLAGIGPERRREIISTLNSLADELEASASSRWSGVAPAGAIPAPVSAAHSHAVGIPKPISAAPAIG